MMCGMAYGILLFLTLNGKLLYGPSGKWEADNFLVEAENCLVACLWNALANILYCCVCVERYELLRSSEETI